MHDEFEGSMDVCTDVSSDSDISCEDNSIDFASEDIFDTPQEDDVESDISDGAAGDVYEASSLDEIEILEEGGDTHTVAERMEELYGENLIGEDLMPAQEGLREYEDGTSSERLEEFRESKETLGELKAALLAGDANALEMFGLDAEESSGDDGFQKVLRR